MILPPTKRTIIAPENGWQDNELWLVHVSVTPGNPVHQALFFTGYLNSHGEPDSYDILFSPDQTNYVSLSDLHYLKPIRNLDVSFDFVTENDEL